MVSPLADAWAVNVSPVPVPGEPRFAKVLTRAIVTALRLASTVGAK
jgi:hypothetical protein